jgi:hypothetical protein
MKTSKAIKIIFDQTVKSVGKDKAPSAFSVTLSSIAYDLNEAGTFTPEAFEKAIQEEAELCLKCTNNEDVA